MDFFFTFSLGRRKFNEESRDTRIRNEGKRKIRKKKETSWRMEQRVRKTEIQGMKWKRAVEKEIWKEKKKLCSDIGKEIRMIKRE